MIYTHKVGRLDVFFEDNDQVRIDFECSFKLTRLAQGALIGEGNEDRTAPIDREML